MDSCAGCELRELFPSIASEIKHSARRAAFLELSSPSACCTIGVASRLLTAECFACSCVWCCSVAHRVQLAQSRSKPIARGLFATKYTGIQYNMERRIGRGDRVRLWLVLLRSLRRCNVHAAHTRFHWERKLERLELTTRGTRWNRSCGQQTLRPKAPGAPCSPPHPKTQAVWSVQRVPKRRKHRIETGLQFT